MRRVIPVLLVVALSCGCGHILPHSKTTTPSGWSDFDGAKASFDSIVPGETSTADLLVMGFDPDHTANLRRLNYLELIEVFMPHPSILRTDLDPALQKCLDAREACYGFEARPGTSHKERHGNVLLDLLSFRRQTRTTGWRFTSLIVVNGEIVAYKIWSGEPYMASEEVESVPLGPFQGVGKKLADRVTN